MTGLQTTLTTTGRVHYKSPAEAIVRKGHRPSQGDPKS